VSVIQNREKGVVTLGGQVALESEKGQAESIATSIATGLVVADQIAVLPLGAEGDARTMNSDLDKGIEHNLDTALIQIIKGAHEPRTGVAATLLGLVTLLFGASSLFVELHEALNTIWHVSPPPDRTNAATAVRLIRDRFYSSIRSRWC
jgi:hypothetical protein